MEGKEINVDISLDEGWLIIERFPKNYPISSHHWCCLDGL